MGANGTLGGSSFAVQASSENGTTYQAYKCFDNSNTTLWNTAATDLSNPWYIFYNPVKLNVTNIAIRNYSNGYHCASGSVLASDTNSNYVKLCDFTGGQTASAWWNIDLSTNTKSYKYYKLSLIPKSTYIQFTDISITAQQLSDISNSITFPTAYSSTNYSYAFESVGSFIQSYATSKSKTGMSVFNLQATSGNVNWLSLGY